MAKIFLDMGFYIGVGGVVTFNNGRKLKDVVEYLPLEKIVVETDCPYLAPTPFRGKRNDSGKLTYVLDQIAEIKGVSREEVEETTSRNAFDLYKKLK
jgi:TatD DNase family protein